MGMSKRNESVTGQSLALSALTDATLRESIEIQAGRPQTRSSTVRESRIALDVLRGIERKALFYQTARKA